jgi:uncharacterized MAPEG superfamily protein
MNHLPETMLVGFAAWTLLLLLTTVGVYRFGRIFRGRAGMGDFPADKIEGQGWYVRAMRAHANCIENLPVFGAIVYVISTIALRGPMVDWLCIAILAARVVQSTVHVSQVQSDRVVAVRFSFYSVQLVSFLTLILMAVMHTRFYLNHGA